MMSNVAEQLREKGPGAFGLAGQLDLEAGAVLLDIEGTLSPISFVRDVLFVYAKERLAAFVDGHRDDPVVAEILEQASRLSGGGDAVAALLGWQERDEKVAPLKKLQGLIWSEGYRMGEFRSPIYQDAWAALQAWRAAGLPLYIYSSGSRHAQRLFFAHSREGDQRGLFSGHFDTEFGAKTDPVSYARIAGEIGGVPGAIVFFTDNVRELEAAHAAGLQVVHVVKDETAPDPAWPGISDYDQVTITRRA